MRLTVRGQVQGVGFRPFVHRLAVELGLSGWVRNDGGGVTLEVQGDPLAVESLLARIRREAPIPARVDAVEPARAAIRDEEHGFAVVASAGGMPRTAVSPDGAPCDDCLRELFDPRDRRYRYAFINCTQCGPRHTITRSLPYDRCNTSMAVFTQCPGCQREYGDPSHRRFHAQPNACPECGPALALLDAGGSRAVYGDAIAEASARLKRGEILAVKGVGGYQLMCNARDREAVARLRARKGRDEKPFAVMCANVHSLGGLAHVHAAQRRVLEARERPVVLLRKHGDCDRMLVHVAPGVAWLGVMLPCSPLHYLLFHEAAGRPAGTHWLGTAHPDVCVCTSANPAGEPLVIDDQEAVSRLEGIADAFLVHDRRIVARADDSVVRVHGGRVTLVRRGRGHVPSAVRLPRAGEPVLALGGWHRNTVCLTRGAEAFVSAHVGDLDNAATCRALEETVSQLSAVLGVVPERIACDLHPDFYSSRLAARLAREWQVPLIAVQHHHAHLAAVQAEHALEGPVLGLALDGVGLGTDGAAWGGELLRLDGARFRRLGHLRPLPLPGSDRAAREPWRMAAAALHVLGRGEEIAGRFPDRPGAGLAAMLARDVNCPRTTSLGRLFDAAAGLLDVKPVAAYEGQAAMLLEGLAERHGRAAPLEAGWILADGMLDFTPLLAALSRAREAGPAAAVFHATVAAGLAQWLERTAREHGVGELVLGGGCCLNRVLMDDLGERLRARGLRALHAVAVPPNDGGLSLGQAWVAMRTPVSPAADGAAPGG